MARQFSEGRFQNQFFETVHAMLDNENSAYDPLIHDAGDDACMLLRQAQPPYSVFDP